MFAYGTTEAPSGYFIYSGALAIACFYEDSGSEKKPTLNVGMRTVCHLRTWILASARSSICIFKCLHERNIDFHLLAKLPKNKKKLFRAL